MSLLSSTPYPRLRINTSVFHYAGILSRIVSGRFANGREIAELEEAVRQRVGTKAAIAMPLARSAIYHLLRAMVRPGRRRIILSPYTIADIVNMVVCAGGVPVFADIDRSTCNIALPSVAELIDSETAAVMVTHFYGLVCDVHGIRDICDRRGVPMIEDAAQAFGASLDGKAAGTFGAAGIYSFGMYKVVNSFLGGMVVTDNQALADDLRRSIAGLPVQPVATYLKKAASALATDLVTFPPLFSRVFFPLFRYAFVNDVDAINNRLRIDVDPRLKTEMPAEYLCRMSAAQANLILKTLDRAAEDIAHRIRTAQQYHEGLRDIDALIVPPLRTDGSHAYWYYPLQYGNRAALVKFAMQHGRDITMSHHRNCADLACFAQWRRDCPNARATGDALIYLPTYPRYSDEEVARTVTAIRKFFGKAQ